MTKAITAHKSVAITNDGPDSNRSGASTAMQSSDRHSLDDQEFQRTHGTGGQRPKHEYRENKKQNSFLAPVVSRSRVMRRAGYWIGALPGITILAGPSFSRHS